MAREEEINIDASRYIEENTINGYVAISDHKDSFIEGAEWADSNPKSPWISVDKDLPCNHEELIENEYYTKKVLVVLAWDDDPSKKHIEICDMCNRIGSFNTNWYWRHMSYFHVVYWMPLPELPKE